MSALLIIDVQYDFMKGGSLEVANTTEILEPINNLRKNKKFDIVILSQDWHPSDHISFSSNNPGTKPYETIPYHNGVQVMWPDHCVQGSRGAEFNEGLNRLPSDIVVRKGQNREVDSYSAFYDNDHRSKTELEDILKQHNIKEIYVCGIASDYCVSYTCLDGANAGFKTYFMEDCSRGVAPDTTQSQIEKMKSNNITIINSTDLY